MSALPGLTLALPKGSNKAGEIKALADNQVNISPKTSEWYGTIVNAPTEKRTEFHTNKLK
jgi:hypothetical protein